MQRANKSFDGWPAYIRLLEEGSAGAGCLDPVSLLPRLGELFRQGERGIGGMSNLQEAPKDRNALRVGFTTCSAAFKLWDSSRYLTLALTLACLVDHVNERHGFLVCGE